MKRALYPSLSLFALSTLLYIGLGASTALATTGNEYIIASQTDESFFCPVDWRTCFTDGERAQIEIPLGKGSELGGGAIQSVTITRDENSIWTDAIWTVQFECYTDGAYTNVCPDWVTPNSRNGYRTYLITESATTTTDNKHWAAYFTNVDNESNFGEYSNPIRIKPNYYYKLIINDNGWNIGAYGSQSLAQPYFVIKGIKSKPDPVIIIPGILGSWEKNGAWVLDPILHTYDNLVDTFLANGYVEGQTLFKFPYDWEAPNEVTATLLKNKIQEVKTTCGCNKVDLVGHSMGGLVAAHYIERDDYTHDVDQLFLLATPLSGAPKAYKAWEGGEMKIGTDFENAFLKAIFFVEALKSGYTNVYDYIHGKPIVSIQELLPVDSNYLKTNTTTLIYPDGYPHNLFLETLINNFNKIKASGVTLRTILADTKTTSTIGGYTIASSTKPGLWLDGQPIATTFVDGDGTVPRISIESVTSVDKEFDFIDHSGVASTSASYLFKELTGNEPFVIIGKIYNPGTSFLKFTLLSPVDMVITAPDGKKLGKDFTSNTEVNQIPDAFYSGFIDDNEYAIIPNPLPGSYKVDTIGTGGGGHYTIVADYADLATTSSAIITGTSTPAIVEPHTFIVSATSTTISPTPPPIATSTPTTTVLTPNTCIKDMTAAYKAKWIGKKIVYKKLVFDCKALKELFKTRDRIEKAQEKKKRADNMHLAATYAGIRRTLANMDLLAKDKGNTKDAVLLIGKYTTWFKTHELRQ